MDLMLGFFIYVTLFRLAVITAGVVSIILGYRLFTIHVKQSEVADIGVQSGKVSITLKNFAPGTCFSLFGAIVIGFSFWHGAPELMLKTINNSKEEISKELLMKGVNATPQNNFTELGKNYEKMGDYEKAKEYYKNALSSIAEPMNNLAYLYLKNGENKNALDLARLAVHISPDQPSFLHTYAEALNAAGDREEALKVMNMAARLNPVYTHDLNRLRSKE